MQTVYVGMSGGVDSSVTAALLKEQGYKVVGVYMKNWSQDLPGMPCTWKEDYQDAKRVAVQLGIDFKMYDFQSQYRHKVVDYMLNEYKSGRTPNPDIMCNQEIKFKLFLDMALEDGADMIATGHYARILQSGAWRKEHGEREDKNPYSLLPTPYSAALFTARNYDKDQTYFMYRVSQKALTKVLLPIGEFKTKAEVREIAKKMKLATADKKDSQGICFVGNVGIREFLEYELEPQAPGAIIDQKGQNIGQHDGAIFYTIGQRHGLDVGGGMPYYVVGKDMVKNEVYVTSDIQDDKLWHDSIKLTDTHWINNKPEANKTYQVRTRYRASLINCQIDGNVLKLAEPVRALTSGQSAVLYEGDRVVGGGIVI